MSGTSGAIVRKDATPLAVVVINDKQFRISKAAVHHTVYGTPSQFSITLPLADALGNQLVDTTTLNDCWNNAYQPFDLYMGMSFMGQPAVLDYLGTATVDSCATRYSTSEGELLQLDGPDLLGLFSQQQINPTNYMNSKSSDIALKWAEGHNLIPQVTATSLPIKNYYQQDTSYMNALGETQLDMLQFLAQMEGFIFYCQGSTFYFGPPKLGPTFDVYYKDGIHNDTVYDLEVTRHPRGNKNVLVIGQTYDRHHKASYVVGQQKNQTAPLTPGGGLNFDLPAGVNPFSGAGLSFSLGSTPPLDVVQEGSADASLVVQFTAPVGTNRALLRTMAQAKLLQLLHSERTVTASVPGNTAILRNTQAVLHPGTVLSTAAGTYYVSTLAHDFDPQSGFVTTFTATSFPYGYQTS